MRILDKTPSLKQAAMRAAMLPQACVYVGDEPRDVMAAMNAGYGASIAVATGPASYRMLTDHPQYGAEPHHTLDGRTDRIAGTAEGRSEHRDCRATAA